MNDDARFFFCLSGFVGFTIFFVLALALHNNASMALLHGSLGCMLFSICGRFLLGLLLRANLLARDVVLSRDGNGDAKLDLSSSQNTSDPADPSLAATQAMSEAATKKTMVEAKA